jgi:hypothetical protein
VSVIPKGSVSTIALQEITKHACDIDVCDGCEREADINQRLRQVRIGIAQSWKEFCVKSHLVILTKVHDGLRHETEVR